MFWKKLFKDDFESHSFLDRSDAVYICKKAQSDVYDELMTKLKLKLSQSELLTGSFDNEQEIGRHDGVELQLKQTIEYLEKAKECLWAEDISDLGMLKKSKTPQEEMADKLKKSPDKNDIEVIMKVNEACKSLLNDKSVQSTVEKIGAINICLEQNINVSINIKTV